MEWFDKLISHWPFFASALVLAMVMQVWKNTVLTEAKVKKSKLVAFGHKTLPLHPVVLGSLLGLVPKIPVSPGIEGWSGKMLYFAAAGVLSTWIFKVIQQWAKKKGIELPIGNDVPPKP